MSLQQLHRWMRVEEMSFVRRGQGRQRRSQFLRRLANGMAEVWLGIEQDS